MPEIEIVERPYENQEIITNNETILPKRKRNEILQKHSESKLTDKLAIKEYSPRLLPLTQPDQGPVIIGFRTFKHRADDLANMNIEGFTTIKEEALQAAIEIVI
ncbi:2933_t:CDS:2 [Gigaspora margarita]|uniref:2933_t:CDS:1 n=1 Tax=Gigaspora margarita TaxID=4874 RepID=A0ABN7WCU1_GIGMA|nr:2933_t:CDS:2 [Gigaspora margarita]